MSALYEPDWLEIRVNPPTSSAAVTAMATNRSTGGACDRRRARRRGLRGDIATTS
jgi:hypothetical protein